MLAQERYVTRLRERAAAQRKNARLIERRKLTDCADQLIRFHFAEFEFSEARENFGDREGRGFLDFPIEIDHGPADLPREQHCGCGFAATHEAGKADESARACFAGHFPGRGKLKRTEML